MSCREWVEKLLSVKFENLTELALHLLEKMYVDNRYTVVIDLSSEAIITYYIVRHPLVHPY